MKTYGSGRSSNESVRQLREELAVKDRELAALRKKAEELEYRISKSSVDGMHVSENDGVSLPAGEPAATADMAAALRRLQREVAEHKQTEEALRESRERFKELAELLPETIFEMDIDGNLLFVNQGAYEQFGYSQEDYQRGLKAFDMLVPEERERAKRNAGRILSGDELGINEYRAQRKDGSTFEVILHSAVINRNGRPAGLRGFIIDISEKKKLEEQLQQASRMEAIGTLAGGIAHDFNNLLMCIQGNVSLLLLNKDHNAAYHEKLKNIEQYIQQGADLSRQLLGFARGGKYEAKPTDINELIVRSSEMFGRTKKEIVIYRKLQDDLWTVEVDRGQIEQVLLNLYVNAWQAMPDGGDILIKSENFIFEREQFKAPELKLGKYIKISVTDTGVGMDQATQRRIFDPFFTTKELGRGTGLGLASAYGVIKNHEGMITVESDSERGSTFVIWLPASDRPLPAENDAGDDIMKGSGTILLVDDEGMILNVGRELLTLLGYAVIAVDNGGDALDIYREKYREIDLVVLDMIMPGMNGGRVFDELKEINPEVRAILSSGYSIDGEAQEILNRGCQGFIQKPFNAEELSRKLREVLEDRCRAG
jgi:PAS domain S-box-containing protein